MYKLTRICIRYLSNRECFYKIQPSLRGYSSQKEIKWQKRIFSGIQPSGSLHLGNYFGAVKNWVDLQNDNDVIYSIVDLHALTLPWDPEEVNSNILLITASLLACGVDPSKSILFQQSRVHQHTELCWVLGCLSTMARLSHLPQYKDKISTIKDVPLGLFSYPVLQAADILLYKATHVPVGEDQEQHIQIAQTLARMFNNRFGTTFPLPQGVIQGNESSRIRSLREPERKMSKSHKDSKSRIQLTDTPDKILDKVKKAVTDFTSKVTYEPETRPGVANLIVLHSLATNKTCEDVCSENSNIDTGKYKLIVAEALIELINPIRKEIHRLLGSPEYLEDVLEEGAVKANQIAEKTWSEVRQRIGIELNYKQHISNETVHSLQENRIIKQ